ncbi:23S rRNA (uracil(1939)-C(5))-methyltransferase RlmD [Caldisalinibacter kiritimatiensis]|uniref:RNA methyltransferase, TrmA family n=1 Tax=Caldisalinibacter kiritimatiensis TaxID=1304284 RepID=R1CW35_9FIRM|nr:23S rRNA (uracil(1939)-C(5))-methyltransferase RlmD [Caldisalinibacter kiritimatiensis]EOD00849.1 RNA methyltransferase, TrmA family [Caldisalinibacter kiritimatiensis]
MSRPVEKNKIYEVEIIDLNHRGQGVAKLDNFAIFVNNGIPGDIVKVKIVQVKKNYGVGELIEIVKPSENRVEPVSTVANECGGCQIQNIKYDVQLEMKKNKVANDIKRIGKLEDVLIHDTIGMKEPFRYRNKGAFPVGEQKGKVVIGPYKRGTHEIIDTNRCIIQHEAADKVIELLREYMEKYNIKPYDETTGKGIIRHVMTRVAFKTGDLMVIIVTNGKDLPHKKALVKLLKDNLENLKSIVQNINSRRTNVILGPKNRTIYGEDKIVDYIDDLKFNISPQSFFQVNPVQTEILYNKALEYADLKGDEVVFDIYCGIGTISLFLARKAKYVYGIEVVKQAIIDARENAETNGIHNVEFYDGTAEEVFPKLYKQGIKADVVVLDPPRKGCDESVLDTIVQMQPKKVVYVSCNPSTLARDLKYLDENGYKTQEIQPVDMFPHTTHVETVVLIEKK